MLAGLVLGLAGAVGAGPRRGAQGRDVDRERVASGQVLSEIDHLVARPSAFAANSPTTSRHNGCTLSSAMGSMLSDVLQDVRFGLRLLRRSPVFTTVAVSSLALGIGGAAAVFSLLNAIVLRSLPVAEPDRLFVAERHSPDDMSPRFSWLETGRLRDELAGKAELAAASSMSPCSRAASSGPDAGCRRSRARFDPTGLGGVLQRARAAAAGWTAADARRQSRARRSPGRGRQPRILEAQSRERAGRDRPDPGHQRRTLHDRGHHRAGVLRHDRLDARPRRLGAADDASRPFATAATSARPTTRTRASRGRRRRTSSG